MSSIILKKTKSFFREPMVGPPKACRNPPRGSPGAGQGVNKVKQHGQKSLESVNFHLISRPTADSFPSKGKPS